MANTPNQLEAIFAEAVLTTIEQCLERGKLGPLGPPLNGSVDSLMLVLGGMLVGGDAGGALWLAGREFCGKLLDNIPDADSYEVCALLREAIERGTCLYDNEGVAGGEFLTQEYQELMNTVGAFSLST